MRSRVADTYEILKELPLDRLTILTERLMDSLTEKPLKTHFSKSARKRDPDDVKAAYTVISEKFSFNELADLISLLTGSPPENEKQIIRKIPGYSLCLSGRLGKLYYESLSFYMQSGPKGNLSETLGISNTHIIRDIRRKLMFAGCIKGGWRYGANTEVTDEGKKIYQELKEKYATNI